MKEKILKLLEKANITQEELAKNIGVRPSAITWWLNGRSKPSAKNIYKLAQYFKVPIEYFYLLDFIDTPINNYKSGQSINNIVIEEISTINIGLKMEKEIYYIYYVQKEDDTVRFEVGTKLTINVKEEIKNDDIVIIKIKKNKRHLIRKIIIGEDQIVLINKDFEIIKKSDIECMYLIERYENKTRNN